MSLRNRSWGPRSVLLLTAPHPLGLTALPAPGFSHFQPTHLRLTRGWWDLRSECTAGALIGASRVQSQRLALETDPRLSMTALQFGDLGLRGCRALGTELGSTRRVHLGNSKLSVGQLQAGAPGKR